MPTERKPDFDTAPDLLDRIIRGNWVGRIREMNEANIQLQRAISGLGQVILINGEPGIGKTRFVRELVVTANLAGASVLTAECYTEGGAPYAPLAQMIQEALAKADQAGFRFPNEILSDLLPIVPSLRLRLPDSYPALSLDPLAEQQRIFEGFTALCSMLSSQGVVLLFIDDAHWADTGTLFLLRNLARRGRNLPILIVMTYREADLESAPVLNEVLVDLNHERLATHLRLARLSRDETSDLLTSILADEIAPDFLDGIYRQTEGNPFYIEEVCKALVEGNQLSFRDGHWHFPAIAEIQIPQTVRAAIQARLQKLPVSAQDALRMAAILGGEFDFETLRRSGNLDEENLITALESALHAQLISEVQTGKPGVPRFCFVHGLIPTTLRESIIHVRRKRLHQRAAEAIEAVHPDDFELLAYHFVQAGEPERAREYFMRAGNRAEQTAPGDAIRFFRAALERWGEDEDLPGRATILARLGTCLWWIGDIPEALKCFEGAYTLFVRLDNRIQSGEMQRMLGRMEWERADRELALNHYHKALAILEVGPETPELARAISSISQMHMIFHESDQAIAWGERALALAERLGAEDIVVHALNNIGTSYAQKGVLEKGLPILRESLQRSIAASLALDACRAYYNLGGILQLQCQYIEAKELTEALLSYASKTYVKNLANLALWRLMDINWLTGQWNAALVFRDQMAEFNSGLYTTWAKRIFGLIDLDLNRLEAARCELEESLPSAMRAMDFQTTVTHQGQLARAYSALGQVAKMYATIQEMLSFVSGAQDHSKESITPLLIACQQFTALSLPDALKQAKVCVSLLEQHMIQFRTGEANAALYEAQGCLMAAEKHPLEAAEFFRKAAVEWERIDRRYDQARAHGSCGRSLKAAGDSAGANAAYIQAFDIFDNLAGQLDPERRDSFMQSALVQSVRKAVTDLSHPNPPENIRPEFGSLTKREVEVLKLVAQGLQNAQIAEILVLSPLTVNTHLRSIFNKLDVTTRTAAVHHALEQGLV